MIPRALWSGVAGRAAASAAKDPKPVSREGGMGDELALRTRRHAGHKAGERLGAGDLRVRAGARPDAPETPRPGGAPGGRTAPPPPRRRAPTQMRPCPARGTPHRPP